MSSKKKASPTPLIVITLLVAVFASFQFVGLLATETDVLGTSTWIAKGGDDDNSGSGSSNSGKSDDDDSDDDDDDDDDDSSSGSSNSGSGSSDDDNDNSGSGSSNSGSSNDDDDDSGSNSGSSGSGSSGDDSEEFSSVDKGQPLSLPSNTIGECEGPDGKKFTTSFGACNDLNKSWGQSSFEFEKIETRSSSVSNVEDNDDDNEEDEQEEEHESESFSDDGTRVRTEQKEDEQRTEIKISETERIRTRTKDGKTRIDITSGGIKTRLEREEDRVVIKAEREDESEVELEDDTIVKIEERLDKSNIKVATSSAEAFLIQRGTAAVRVDFPVTIDLVTNILSVNTPQGEKVLTVLPDQVVSNLLVTGIVDRLDPTLLTEEFQPGELAAVTDVLSLETQEDELVYEIKGFSDQRLLGLFPVTIEKDLTVSADSGELISEEVGFVDTVLDIFSF